jgi:hypothetical protein
MYMKRILVLDNPTVVVWVYPERKIVHKVMKAYCYGADYREALDKGLEALELHKGTKWLSDLRAGGPLPKDDEVWSQTVWMARALAVGWKHWSIVQPAKILGQLNVKRAIKTLSEMGINAQMFSDPDEAMRWLDAL